MTIKTVQVAPMVGVTTQHFNHFIRLISDRVGLYTEMTSTNSIRHGNVLSRVDKVYSKQIIQLAGNMPDELGYCAHKAEMAGYSGVNLNVGCPSCKIKKANYGAVLFKYPALVAEAVKSMKESCSIPVSVKTRIGVDHIDSYQYLANFVEILLKNNCDEIIIHARKAYLKGLSPKANRTIPPLRYEVLSQLEQDFPEANFCLNGGITTIKQVKELFGTFDNLMLGRVIEKNPLILQDIDYFLYGDKACLSRLDIYRSYMDYVRSNIDRYNKIMLIKPLFGLYFGTNISKKWHCAVINSFNRKNGFSFQELDSLAASEGA